MYGIPLRSVGQSGHGWGKDLLRRFNRKELRGHCSEVRAVPKEPTGCVEVPGGGIRTTPGPGGTWGGSDAAGVHSRAVVLVGAAGLKLGLQEKRVLLGCGHVEGTGTDVLWLLSPPSLSSPVRPSTIQTQPAVKWQGSRRWSPQCEPPQGTEARERPGLDGGGEMRMTSPVCTFQCMGRVGFCV